MVNGQMIRVEAETLAPLLKAAHTLQIHELQNNAHSSLLLHCERFFAGGFPPRGRCASCLGMRCLSLGLVLVSLHRLWKKSCDSHRGIFGFGTRPRTTRDLKDDTGDGLQYHGHSFSADFPKFRAVICMDKVKLACGRVEYQERLVKNPR